MEKELYDNGDSFDRERLLRKMEREIEQCRERLHDLRSGSLRENTGELSVADNHPADLGSETFERGKDLALAARQSERIGALQAAVERLKDGSYGRCNVCGNSIEAERLEILPEAETCAACARAVGGMTHRPVEEEVLSYTFGGRGSEFDREDAWQAVARYGTADSPQDSPPARRVDDAYLHSGESLGIVEPLEAEQVLQGEMDDDAD